MGNQTVDPDNLKKISEEYLKSNSIYWMYCPKCYLIPSIKPFLMKGKLCISLYCKCLYDEKLFMTFQEYIDLLNNNKTTGNFCKKHSYTEAVLFCISCEKWLCNNCFIAHKEKYPKHLFYNIPVRIKEYCHRHEKELAVGYCNKCSKSICENCKIAKKKLRHDIFEFNPTDNIERCNKKWNSFSELHVSFKCKNEKLLKEVINLINDSKDMSNDDKNNLINRLTEAHKKNVEINNKLLEYILFLYSNLNFSYHVGGILNRNILFNIYNLKLDYTIFTIKPQLSALKNAEKLIKYFENIYTVKLNPIVNIKNLSTDRENVTKQISKVCLLEPSNAATLTSKGIVIVWNYLNYEELYRIKKLTMNEKTYLEKMDNNYQKAPIMDDNYLLYLLGDDDDDDFINERIFRQQTQILNSIQNNVNGNKTITILKVYNLNNTTKLNSSNNSNGGDQNYNDTFNQNEINNLNNIRFFDEEEDALELNYNFSSMAYIQKQKILCLIIDNCKDIYLFDIIKKEALKEKLIGHKKEVLEILALKDGTLASYGMDFAIRIWNMKRFQNTLTINAEIKKYYIYFTQLLYGNLIFATDKSLIKILKLPEYEFDKDITCVDQPMNYFELPDKKLIISSDDFCVKILRPPDYKEVTFLFNKKRTKIYSFLLLDRDRLLVGLEDNNIHLLYLNNKKHKNNMSITSHLSPIGTLVKTNENDDKNNRITSISWDNVVKVFLIGD
jgi:hypothetical protein